MKRARNASTQLAAVAWGAACMLLLGSAWAQAPLSASPAAPLVAVETGVHKLLRQPQEVTRVAVGDPAVAEVTVVNRREVLVTGKKVGVTSLLIWPKGAATAQEFRLRVGPVVDPLKPKLVDPETSKAKSDAQDGLTGSTDSLLAHRRAKIAADLRAQTETGKAVAVPDRSSVDLDTQVMTEVKIVEVKRSTLQQMGLNFLKNSANSTAGLLTPGSLSTIEAPSAGSSAGYDATVAVPIREAFNLVIGNPADGLLGVLSLLENRGLARTYAEPTLTAMSGQTASFLAGGEFPVPVSQGGANSSITINYREFGIRLSLTPTVLSRDRISLKVAPEVSDLDFSAGITSGGVSVPALSVRRTDTTVELGDGESFVISGLVSNSMINSVDKVPWLGDLPVIGAFFKRSNINREQRELVMVVTPRLVRPLARDARRPALPGAELETYKPSFGQLMLFESGKFETESFGFSK